MNFSQIFRLLSLYMPIKTALRGSVQGEPNAVLVSVEEILKTAAETHRSNKASLRNEIEARLLEMTTFPCVTPDQMSDEHSYFRGSPDDSVVYYLSGYIVHKVSKRTECQLCLHDISSAAPVVCSDAYLTRYRSFKEGSLRHPSIKMLHFVRVVNESVSLSLNEEGLCGDLFWKVLDELDECYLTRLGCDQHKPTFRCQVLYFSLSRGCISMPGMSTGAFKPARKSPSPAKKLVYCEAMLNSFIVGASFVPGNKCFSCY